MGNILSGILIFAIGDTKIYVPDKTEATAYRGHLSGIRYFGIGVIPDKSAEVSPIRLYGISHIKQKSGLYGISPIELNGTSHLESRLRLLGAKISKRTILKHRVPLIDLLLKSLNIVLKTVQIPGKTCSKR